MAWRDVMAVCTNGHVVTDALRSSVGDIPGHCDKCGSPVITDCPTCHAPIPGVIHYEDVVALGSPMNAPAHCANCGSAFPWGQYAVQRDANLVRGDIRKGLAVILMPMSETDPSMEDTFVSIRETAATLGLTTWRADSPPTSGDIVGEVLEAIDTAEYVIADLSHERPSVYYEVGWAHGKGIGPANVVLIAQVDTRVHFDMRNLRIIFYKNQTDLRARLEERLRELAAQGR